MNWNLEALYKSFDDPRYEEDLASLRELATIMEEWSNHLEDDSLTITLEKYIEHATVLTELEERLGAYASLNFAVDTSNQRALNYENEVERIMTTFAGPLAKFKQFLSRQALDDLEASIKGNRLLEDHRFHLMEQFKQAEHLLTEKEEILLSRLKQTGSSAWETLQNIVVSTTKVSIDGEEKPLTAVRNMAYSPDPKIRKTAYEQELKAYKHFEEVSAFSLNSIKGEVLTTCDLRGFASPLDQALFNSRMSKETLEAMLTAMEEALPSFRKYFRHKAKLLGHKNGLPFYDIFAPIGKASTSYSIEEAKELIIDKFSAFSPELKAYAEKAFEGSWIDFPPKPGKVGGAFCANLGCIHESRFLLNFDGSLNNVITLAHELGHGYHGEQIFNEAPLNTSYPMPLAETASIFCETIVKKAALASASPEEQVAIREASIQGYAQVIVDIYARYLFESALFDRRHKGSASVEDLKDMMLSAQKNAFGDGLDPDYLHPYMWMNKPHYYSAGQSFYNFPYAFGLLFAKGIYRQYQAQGQDFIPKYNELLAATGKHTIEEVAALVKVDITKPAFWQESLQEIVEEIDTFIQLT